MHRTRSGKDRQTDTTRGQCDYYLPTKGRLGHTNSEISCKSKRERVVDGALSQISTLKFLTHKHPQVSPLGHDRGDRMLLPFDMFHTFYL